MLLVPIVTLICLKVPVLPSLPVLTRLSVLHVVFFGEFCL